MSALAPDRVGQHNGELVHRERSARIQVGPPSPRGVPAVPHYPTEAELRPGQNATCRSATADPSRSGRCRSRRRRRPRAPGMLRRWRRPRRGAAFVSRAATFDVDIRTESTSAAEGGTGRAISRRGLLLRCAIQDLVHRLPPSTDAACAGCAATRGYRRWSRTGGFQRGGQGSTRSRPRLSGRTRGRRRTGRSGVPIPGPGLR